MWETTACPACGASVIEATDKRDASVVLLDPEPREGGVFWISGCSGGGRAVAYPSPDPRGWDEHEC